MKTNKKKKKAFSKIAISCLTAIWMLVAVAGLLISVIDFAVYGTYNFKDLFDFVDTPMSCGIIGYLAKSGLENWEREKNRHNEAGSDQSEESEKNTAHNRAE